MYFKSVCKGSLLHNLIKAVVMCHNYAALCSLILVLGFLFFHTYVKLQENTSQTSKISNVSNHIYHTDHNHIKYNKGIFLF